MTTVPTEYRAQASNGSDRARTDAVVIAVTRHIDLFAEPVQVGPERVLAAIGRRGRGAGPHDRRED